MNAADNKNFHPFARSLSCGLFSFYIIFYLFPVVSAYASDDWDFWSRGEFYHDDTQESSELSNISLSENDQTPKAVRITSLPEKREKILRLENRDFETERLIEELLATGQHGGSRFGIMEVKTGEFFDTDGNKTFTRTDGCPFEFETECTIWKTKPHFRETVAPMPRKIDSGSVMALSSFSKAGQEIDANAPGVRPLLNRYKTLMASSRACCMDGIVYQLKRAGASNDFIYKFILDDANFFHFSERCLMMQDNYLYEHAPDQTTAELVASVRDTCLCRSRKFFDAMLAPFAQIAHATPEFEEQPLNYTYYDGLRRERTVSIRDDVATVIHLLSTCP
ncbi:MAG: hypothetical protein FWG80_00360 [Alphaproteobacteria bacterium]|nr:hypothetical protein [Alphaproteobacteria bacterium]